MESEPTTGSSFCMRVTDAVLYSIFIAAAIALAIFSRDDVHSYWETREWVKTNATIVSLYVWNEVDVMTTDAPVTIEVERCRVTYNYTVSGITYIGNRTNLHDTPSSKELCQRLHASDVVPCFYDPEKQTESSLSLSFSPWHMIIALGAAFFLLNFGVAGVQAAFNPKRNAHKWPSWFLPFSAAFAIVAATALLSIAVDARRRRDDATMVWFGAVVSFAIVATLVLGTFCYNICILVRRRLNYGVLKEQLDVENSVAQA